MKKANGFGSYGLTTNPQTVLGGVAALEAVSSLVKTEMGNGSSNLVAKMLKTAST